MMHSGRLTMVPSDRNRVPAGRSDFAAISRVALPVNAVAYGEALGFGDCHFCIDCGCAHTTCAAFELAQARLGAMADWVR